MKLVIFGLTVSSSWGNGHATLWRGLIRALASRGWNVEFFERDTPYYSANRDLFALPGGELVIYDDWSSIFARARRSLADADVAMVTSFCPDGRAASEAILASPSAIRVFYDLDTPVTLEALARNEAVPYLPVEGLAEFDQVLSFTGGPALQLLASQLGAKRTASLYGHVDPGLYQRSPPDAAYRGDLSYIGTYAADRQQKLERFLVEPARRLPAMRFVIAGALYPQEFPWTDNIYFVRHLAPAKHGSFYASSRLTLNITRRSMAAMGWCPSGRLFEAACCGTPIVSDDWPGLDAFFVPGEEILVAQTTEDVEAALALDPAELQRIGAAARLRVLQQHTSAHRAAELESILNKLASRTAEPIDT